jgi:hypothetical protein
MQVGGKTTQVDLSMYDACRARGAIIATGHEHSYSRTHLMSSFAAQTVVSTSTVLNLAPGQTFAFVSGLGGKSVRPETPSLAANAWWAGVYTSTQGAKPGALFCVFNHLSVYNRAHCYFKDIGGIVADEFDLVSLYAQLPPAVPALSPWGLVLLAMALMVSVHVARRGRGHLLFVYQGRLQADLVPPRRPRGASRC